MKKHITLLALASLGLAAQAADWSDNSIGYRYVSEQSEPGVAGKVSKNILNFTHVSGDSKGMNLFTIDLLRSSSNDAANGSTANGAQEWYGFYKRSFSMKGLTGQPVTMGFAKDLNLNLRMDAGTKNTAFAPAPLKLRAGLSAAMPVSAGFWDLGVDVYKESNHNGLANSGVGKNVNFDTTLALTSAWSVPMGPGSFAGFFDIVGPKGKDGFGDKTKTETLVRATYMFDVGGPKSGWKAGVGVEYWNNKFGCDPSKQTGTKAGSCKATTPMLLAEYHL